MDPSQPSENVLKYNENFSILSINDPSQPSENVLKYNLTQWHYKLLIDFNPATNGTGIIQIHLYFRYRYQGP